MLEHALDWLATGVRTGNLGLDLLPEEFDEAEVKACTASIFGSPAGAEPLAPADGKGGPGRAREGSGRLYHAVRAGMAR